MGVLVLVVLLLVAMPALIYFLGWISKRYLKQPPPWTGSARPAAQAGNQGDEPPARARE